MMRKTKKFIFSVLAIATLSGNAIAEHPSTVYDVISLRDSLCNQSLSPAQVANHDDLFGFLFAIQSVYPAMYDLALNQAAVEYDCNDAANWVLMLKARLKMTANRG